MATLYTTLLTTEPSEVRRISITAEIARNSTTIEFLRYKSSRFVHSVHSHLGRRYISL